MKKNNKKGFTLAELLIVVAIIAVLVAIAIPVFTAQLEKAKEATDMANIRAAYAEVAVTVLDTGAADSSDPVAIKQGTSGWVIEHKIDGVEVPNVATGNTVTVNVSADGVVSFTTT